MRKTFFFLLLIFTLPVFAKNTILIVGDSLSAGFGINPKQGWVSLLQKQLDEGKHPYQVVNLSISGATTSNAITRLPNALNQYKPEITIIELGGNDGLRGLQINVIKENLKKLITMVKSVKSKVILLGVRLPPNFGPDYTNQFQRLFQELSQEEKVALVPLFLKGIDTDMSLMQPDRIHPNLKAQKILFDNVWPTLETML